MVQCSAVCFLWRLYTRRFNEQRTKCDRKLADNLPVSPEDECFSSFIQDGYVKRLNGNIYQSHEATDSSIIFTPDHDAINKVRNKILGSHCLADEEGEEDGLSLEKEPA